MGHPGARATASFLAMVTMAAAALGLPAAAGAAASPWAENPQSSVRLVTAYQAAPRHGEVRLGIQFRLAPNWHVYWKNSGDAGYAPVVAFARQDGLSYPELLWPAPHRFELAGGLEAFGYESGVIYPVRARVDTPADRLHLAADVDYLVCEVDCVPHRYTLALDQPLADRPVLDPATAPLLDAAFAAVPAAAGAQPGVAVTGSLAEAPLTLVVALRGVRAAPQGADLFFEVHPALELGRPRPVPQPDGLAFVVPASRKDTSAALPASIEIAWTATGLRIPSTGGASPEQAAAAPATAAPATALTGHLHVPVTLSVPPALAAAVAAAGTSGGAAGGATRGAASGAPGTSAAGAAGAGAAQPPPAGGAPGTTAGGLRAPLAQGDPRLVGLLAAAAALLALHLWGLLRGSARPAGAAAPVPAGREALGFAALLAIFGLLYALSLEVTPEGLAGVEVALLAMGLLAWLRRSRRSAAARLLLALAVAACALTPPWLAGRNRLLYPGPGSEPRGAGHSQAPSQPPA